MPTRSSKGSVKSPKFKPAVKSHLPKPLKPSETFKSCNTTLLDFKTTKNVGQTHDIIAQDRAIKAINLGLGIHKPGYNIYVAGYEGTGKTSVIRSFLEKWSKKSDSPRDWVYVYNFEQPEQPNAIPFEPGHAKKFKKQMEALLKQFRHEIPDALQSEDYENAVNTCLSQANERKNKLFHELEKFAISQDFMIKSSKVGIETIPTANGNPISDKEYASLPEKQRMEIEARRNVLEPEVLDFVRKVRSIDSESREYIENLQTDLGSHLVSALMENIMEYYHDNEEVMTYLESVKEYASENLLDFVIMEDDGEEGQPPRQHEDYESNFKKYTVNVFVDNTATKGAPVIIENNPNYYNLFGKVEKNVEYGVYNTDFTMVKAGTLHRANGGYLVLNALDIFRNGSIWEMLKRVLRNRTAFIEDMGEQYSLLPTSGLRPEPIPLDVKVIMIGTDEIYHILYEEDEEFRKIFKVKADFDYRMERNAKNIKSYASFIATRSAIEGLKPFDRNAVAAIVEHSSRLVEDQKYLSTLFGEIKDLTIESDFIAREEGATTIRRKHVAKALDEKFYRLNLYEDHVLDMIKHDDILLTVDGHRVGQINGLTVYDMADYAFGKIARITVTSSVSDEGLFNIERASRLSGRIHDKGVLIIGGFLHGLLAKQKNLGVSARICFEQSYGYIDGDSASAAELVAIISSIAGIPVKQNFAITGSMNQLGEIQPIGGVNEKIEGFVKICKLLSKAKKGFGIIIPYQNKNNLMLHAEVQEAIKSGYVQIYPVKHVWEAFELLTDVKFGVTDYFQEVFSEGSALEAIQLKLAALDADDDEDDEEEEPVEAKKPKKKTKKSRSRSRSK